MTEFKNGDRVRIKADKADDFLQPWRDRFKRGRMGTVTGTLFIESVRVQWDHRSSAKPYDFALDHDPRDLERADT